MINRISCHTDWAESRQVDLIVINFYLKAFNYFAKINPRKKLSQYFLNYSWISISGTIKGDKKLVPQRMFQLSEALDKWDFRQNVPPIKIFTNNEYYKGWFARYIFDIFNDSTKLGSLKKICYLFLLSSDSQLQRCQPRYFHGQHSNFRKTRQKSHLSGHFCWRDNKKWSHLSGFPVKRSFFAYARIGKFQGEWEISPTKRKSQLSGVSLIEIPLYIN